MCYIVNPWTESFGTVEIILQDSVTGENRLYMTHYLQNLLYLYEKNLSQIKNISNHNNPDNYYLISNQGIMLFSNKIITIFENFDNKLLELKISLSENPKNKQFLHIILRKIKHKLNILPNFDLFSNWSNPNLLSLSSQILYNMSLILCYFNKKNAVLNNQDQKLKLGIFCIETLVIIKSNK